MLSFGIMIQAIVFAVAQSTGLSSLFGLGCTEISQVVLPSKSRPEDPTLVDTVHDELTASAIFLVPYIQLVFGVEMFLRGLRPAPFAPRGKRSVAICLVILGLGVLANFLVAAFDPAADLCLTYLFWFAAHWSWGCFALLTAIASILLICCIGIFLQLTRSTKIEVTERVAASRMVYYLAVAIISNVSERDFHMQRETRAGLTTDAAKAFMIPFFFMLAFGDYIAGNPDALNLSTVASVVANVTGLMTGCLYLFLRSNTISTIGPKNKVAEYERRKLKYRIRRTSTNDSERPGSSNMMEYNGLGRVRRMNSQASWFSHHANDEARLSSPVYDEKNCVQQPEPLRSNAVRAIINEVPRPPEPAQLPLPSPAPGGHFRERPYAPFPNTLLGPKSSVALLPSTTYSPQAEESILEGLELPPSMGELTGGVGRHRRDSSLVSSATVQIGLRFSSMDDMPHINARGTIGTDSVYDLKEHDVTTPPRLEPKRPSPSPLSTINSPNTLFSNEDARMKTPRAVAGTTGAYPADQESQRAWNEDDGSKKEPENRKEKAATLSPTVYSPHSLANVAKPPNKLPSPKGVGFASPRVAPRLNGSSVCSPRPPRAMVPPRRAASTRTPDPRHTKADWI